MRKGSFLPIFSGCLIALCLFTIPPICALEDTWTIKSSMTTAAGAVGIVTVNGQIYVFDDAITEVYNPKTDTWTQKTPMPTPRHHFAIAAYQNKVYVIGGWIDTGVCTAVNEVYDTTTDSWETKTPMSSERAQLDAHIIEGKIYVISGILGDNQTTTGLNEVYNPVTDLWSEKARIPYSVTAYASAALDGKIYIIGGQTIGSNYGTDRDAIQIFDPENDSWTFGKSAPAIISQAGAVATTGIAAPKRIYVMGGLTGFAEGLDQNLVYDPEVDTWTNATPIPHACFNPAVVAIDDMLYLLGGAQGFDAYKTNLQYTPIGYGTIQPTPTPTPSFSPTPIASTLPILSPTITSPTLTQQPTQLTSPTPLVYDNDTNLIATISVVAIVAAIVIVGALVYFRKRK